MPVTIKWTMRAAGRDAGQVETVELTPFVQGVLKGGKAVLVPEETPAAPVPSVEEVMLTSRVVAAVEAELPAVIEAAIEAQPEVTNESAGTGSGSDS